MSKPTRRQALLSTLAATALLSVASLTTSAWAQAWPSKPLKIVVPFPASGATDSTARLMGDQLARRLGVAVTVENKPGASTIIGVEAVTKAPADGYTLLVAGVGSFSVLPALRSNLPFDIEKDLAPIALVTFSPVMIVTASSKPYKSLADVISTAKANPTAVRYATYGPGSAPHLAGEMLASAAGVTMEAIPYKGAADAAIALLRGDVDIGFETLSAVGPQIKADKLRVLASDGERRSSFMPDAPGLGELGLGRASMEAFYGVMVPAATPVAVRNRLSKEITEIMAMPEMREKSLQMILEPSTQGADALGKLIKSETAKFKAVAQRLNLSLN